MKQTILLFLLVCLGFSCKNNQHITASKDTSSKSINSKIDSLLNTYTTNNSFMGSISILKKDTLFYSKAIGFKDIASNTPVNTDTKYRIGSISKTYTATLIFKAIEARLLTINTPIASYFPDIKNAKKITIAHLLQHRSGIPNFTKDKAFFDYRTQYKSSEDMLSLISGYDSDFEPNTQGDYSNSNYFLLALILEKIYNTSYDDLLQENICRPLGLTSTYSGSKITIENNECYSYSYDNAWLLFPETDLSITKGSGSIISTSEEVNRFMNALFTHQLISKTHLDLMTAIKDTYGMGLLRYNIQDRQGYGHRGHIDGFRSTVIHFPKEDMTFSIFSNGSQIDINTIYNELLIYYFNDTPIELSEEELQKFVGTYVYEKDKTDRMVFTQDKNSLIHIIKDEFRTPLIYKGKQRFLFNQVYAESMSFTFSPDGRKMTLEQGDFKGSYIKE